MREDKGWFQNPILFTVGKLKKKNRILNILKVIWCLLSIGSWRIGHQTVGPRMAGAPDSWAQKVDIWAPDNWDPGPNCL